LTVVDKEIDFC